MVSGVYCYVCKRKRNIQQKVIGLFQRFTLCFHVGFVVVLPSFVFVKFNLCAIASVEKVHLEHYW